MGKEKYTAMLLAFLLCGFTGTWLCPLFGECDKASQTEDGCGFLDRWVYHYIWGPCEASPSEYCEQAADTWARRRAECDPSFSYEKEKSIFIDALAYGDCNTITKIRNSKSFIESCLPWIERISCEVLFNGPRLPACNNQLLVDDLEYGSEL